MAQMAFPLEMTTGPMTFRVLNQRAVGDEVHMGIELTQLRLTRAQFNDMDPESRAAYADIVVITDEPVEMSEEPPCPCGCGLSVEEAEWMDREEEGNG